MARYPIDFDVLAREVTPPHLAPLIGAECLGGKSYLCPFCGSKKATINRKDDPQGSRTVFRCFRCQEKGSPVQVAAKAWDVGLAEAARRLAEHVGIDVARWTARKKHGRPPRKAGPGRVPAELIEDPRIKANEMALYVVLSGYRGEVKQAKLAEHMGCNRDTVRLAANILRGAGWATWRRGQYGNVYALFWRPVDSSQMPDIPTSDRSVDSSQMPDIPTSDRSDACSESQADACSEGQGLTVGGMGGCGTGNEQSHSDLDLDADVSGAHDEVEP